MKKLIVWLGIFILLSIGVLATNAEDYITEFNEPGEICSIDNEFVYYISSPTLFDKERYIVTRPILYRCCSQSKVCIMVVFDIQQEQPMTEQYLSEIFELDNIKKEIDNGDLPKNLYFFKESFDICNYFGIPTLKQESANLAGGVAETITKSSTSKVAKTVYVSVRGARALGLIGVVNPLNLVTSAACYIDGKELKLALEKLTECDGYLSNIDNRQVIAGQVDKLKTCAAESSGLLKEYTGSITAQIKNGVDKIGNAITGAWTFFKGEMKDPSADNKFEFKETEYELAQKALEKVLSINPRLECPNKEGLIAGHKIRLSLKDKEVSEQLNQLGTQLNNITDNMPGLFTRFFSDIFKEPNYNLSNSESLIEDTKRSLQDRVNLYYNYRYNSALNDINHTETLLLDAEAIIVRENNVKRVFDKRWWIIIGSLIILGGCIAYYKKRLNRK